MENQFPNLDSVISCPSAGRCSGCLWIGRSHADQLEEKWQGFRRLWLSAGLPEPALERARWRIVASSGLRDRVDLIFKREGENGRLGLYSLERGRVEPIEQCPQMSPELHAWFEEVRGNPPPIQAGSLRLRVSPSGRRGIWLDFANLDVKKLLESGDWLEWLSARAVVEVGQRRKRLVRRERGWSLADPELEYWMPTFLGDRPQALYSVIGGFTQVGFRANRAIVEEVMRALPARVEGAWLELGTGNGNLTLPLARAGAGVRACEIDELALAGLKRSAEEAGLSDRIVSHRLSFHRPSPGARDLLEGVRGILADPPRSGLLQFPELLSGMSREALPKHFIYLSCLAESFVTDVAALYALGYRLRSLVGIDQFPQTPHAEWLGALERD